MLSDSKDLHYWKAFKRDLWMILSADGIYLDDIYLKLNLSIYFLKFFQTTAKID